MYDLEQYFLKKEREYLNQIKELNEMIASRLQKCATCQLRKQPVKSNSKVNNLVERYQLYRLEENGFRLAGEIELFKTIKIRTVVG